MADVLAQKKDYMPEDYLPGFYRIGSDGTAQGTFLFSDMGEFVGFSKIELVVENRKKVLWRIWDPVSTIRPGFVSMLPQSAKPKLLIEYRYNRRVPKMCLGYEVLVDGRALLPEVMDINLLATKDMIRCAVGVAEGYKLDDLSGVSVPVGCIRRDLIAELLDKGTKHGTKQQRKR